MTSTKPALVPGEHLRFVGSFLEASEEALKRIDRSMLSASTAKAMSPKSCHARYAADKILPRDEDPFGAAPIGTAAHAVLEHLMQLPPEERTPQAAMAILVADGAAMWPDHADGSANHDRARWQKAVWAKVEGLWRIVDPAHVDVVETEWFVKGVEIGGVPFIGYIDLTERDENGDLRVVDYKSGAGKGLDADGRRKLQRYGDDHGDQIRLYKAAVEEMTGERVASGALYYIGEGKAREVSFDKTQMDRTIAGFKESWDELKADVAAGAFEAKASGLCGWCPLVALCPAAHLDGRTPMIEVPTAEELGIEVVSATGAATHQDEDTEEFDQHPQEDPMAYDPADDFDDFFADEAVASEPPAKPEPEPETEPEPVAPPARRPRSSRPAAPETVEVATVTRVQPRPEPQPEQEPIFGEDKPYYAAAKGKPNANSYAATGAFGLAELAITELTKAGVPLRVSSISALAMTFSQVVSDAQESLTGSREPIDGMATRMRGALRSTLEHLPAPIGGTGDEWRTWRSQTTRRCITLGQVAHAILAQPFPDEPYLVLSAEAAEADAA